MNTDFYNSEYCIAYAISYVLPGFLAMLSGIVWQHFKEKSPDEKIISFSQYFNSMSASVDRSEINKKVSRQPCWTAATGYPQIIRQ